MQQISKLSLNSFSKLLESCLIYLPPSLEDAFTLSLYWDDMIKTCVHNSGPSDKVLCLTSFLASSAFSIGRAYDQENAGKVEIVRWGGKRKKYQI